MTPVRLALLPLLLVACQREAPPAAAPPALALVDSTTHLEVLAREAMVVRHPGGTLFVSGYGDTVPHRWKSTDQGASWASIDVASVRDAAGNSDVDLAVARDGTLYLVTMTYDRAAFEGRGIQVAVRRDSGATWTWHQLSATRFDDRPWIEVAPDGTAHVIWNDGTSVAYAVSTDGGATWRERPPIFAGTGSSHLAIGPRGELAVRAVPISASGNGFRAGADSLAISADGGTSWQRVAAPGTREWKPLIDTTVSPPKVGFPDQPRWVEPLAWDSTGALYSLWASGRHVFLARSRDRGTTWHTWTLMAGPATPYFPYLVARGDGQLAASWFTGHGDSLRANVAYLEVGPDSLAPILATAPPFSLDVFGLASRSEPPERDTGGEYLALTFLPDGQLGVVAPVQDVAAKRLGFTWRRYRIVR